MNVFCIHYNKICYVPPTHELYNVVTYCCLDFTGIKFGEKQAELITYFYSFWISHRNRQGLCRTSLCTNVIQYSAQPNQSAF